MGLARVLNISNIAIITVDSVGHGLGAAVREEDIVATVGVVLVAVLVGTEVKVGIAVLDLILVLVVGGFLISRLLVGSRLVGRGGLVRSRPVGSVVGKSDGGKGKGGGEGLKCLERSVKLELPYTYTISA